MKALIVLIECFFQSQLFYSDQTIRKRRDIHDGSCETSDDCGNGGMCNMDLGELGAIFGNLSATFIEC